VLTFIPVSGLPLIQPGDPLADMIVAAVSVFGGFEPGDVLVVAQKVVSKSEGRLVHLNDVIPSEEALELARRTERDPRLVQSILGETREVLRARTGLIIVEDIRGFVCANAGIDRSNIEQTGDSEQVALLPMDPDASAKGMRQRIEALTGVSTGVIVNDSHGRAWREGTVGVAIGVAGFSPLADRRGDEDLTGYVLEHTIIGLADEIAAAASILMGPAAEGIPAVVVRGLSLPPADGSAKDLQRPRERDLFR
jgi:coenzyme F420-0:L-glutamate ligase/coenzyme F420-1:gamma-L-glutamate ligase